MKSASLTIREAEDSDAAPITEIYNHYIRHSTATFEEQRVCPGELARRITAAHSASLPWLVATAGERLVGYAYAVNWKGRSAYRYSVETTVYVDVQMQGRGVGTRLYEALLLGLSERGMHMAMGGIALPNAASIALHERLCFIKVAHFQEVGRKFDRWIDIGYWQRKLP